MKKSVFVIVLLTVLLAAIHLRPAGVSGRDDEQGRKIYNEKCQFCHGTKGNGDGPAAASLSPKPADFNNPKFWQEFDEKKMNDLIRSGRGMMPAFDMKPDEVKAVIDYITHSFKR
jgi:cytochrome c oxidase cbb3-type subunit 3